MPKLILLSITGFLSSFADSSGFLVSYPPLGGREGPIDRGSRKGKKDRGGKGRGRKGDR